MGQGLGLWSIILLRLGVLGGERVAFHGLGRGHGPLATTAVAYGGAAALLWLAAIGTGQAHWVGEAFWPGAVYAASFGLYTASLVRGPVSVVSGFANATVPMLFFLDPHWDAMSVLGMALFGAGAMVLLPRRQGFSPAVLWMLLSGVALVGGRLLDVSHQSLAPLPYAASLFTSVVLWLVVPVTAYDQWPQVASIVRERGGWVMLACITNAVSYLTVLALLRRIAPTMVEAVSAWAGVLATVAGVVIFREGGGRRKVAAALLLTVGTVILLFSQPARMG